MLNVCGRSIADADATATESTRRTPAPHAMSLHIGILLPENRKPGSLGHRRRHLLHREQLRAPAEEVAERRAPLVRVEAVVLADRHPRQRLSHPGELVAAPGQLLLGGEQLEPRSEPLLARSRCVIRHLRSLLSFMAAREALRRVA